MKIRNILLILIFLISFTGVVGATNIQNSPDNYQDYIGDTYVLDSQNISVHPLYIVVETTSDYIITRQGETFNLKKSEANYTFQYDRIIPNSNNLNVRRPFILTYDANIFKNNNGNLKSAKFNWNLEIEASNNTLKQIVKGSVNNGQIIYNLPDFADSIVEHTIIVSSPN